MMRAVSIWYGYLLQVLVAAGYRLHAWHTYQDSGLGNDVQGQGASIKSFSYETLTAVCLLRMNRV
jgi:hypothetical protein